MRRLIAGALIFAACASPGMPPGGPPDVAAPEIIAIAPDSARTGVSPKEVIFRFNEVVSERPPQYATLSDLFIISPREGTPQVSWERDEIAVRPRRGWRPNTAYTVTMLPGLSDIRGNVRNSGASTFFSTGGSLPRTRISGQVFDWVSGAAAPGSLVEAFVAPDTTHPYLAITDTAGRFTMNHLPPGPYSLRAVVDKNKNRGLDPGEAWDSVTVVLADSASPVLLAFVRDSIPPRILDVAVTDSLALLVRFDRPIDPAQTLTASNFSLAGADSAAVPISLAPVQQADTSVRIAAQRRPSPSTQVSLVLRRPLVPGASYRMRGVDIRGLLGNSGTSERVFTTPAPPAIPAVPVPPPAIPIRR
ncbi:MAG TPA: Ig-like domain-containing protein [Gemmatimonadaceae bacterium]|nr:Ig-like domain-containing protein [Gemmatimonadaceae bacterium]